LEKWWLHHLLLSERWPILKMLPSMPQFHRHTSCNYRRIWAVVGPGNGCELLNLRDTEFGCMEASQTLTISRLLIWHQRKREVGVWKLKVWVMWLFRVLLDTKFRRLPVVDDTGKLVSVALSWTYMCQIHVAYWAIFTWICAIVFLSVDFADWSNDYVHSFVHCRLGCWQGVMWWGLHWKWRELQWRLLVMATRRHLHFYY
jgi:hypothetical protein